MFAKPTVWPTCCLDFVLATLHRREPELSAMLIRPAYRNRPSPIWQCRWSVGGPRTRHVAWHHHILGL